ncbi:MAG TPA: maltose ABC transporter substrate-binding protein [Symbiobacteriaceae bacterium]|nr:maltose ABC transporter substrate-binding protein [Symbiobacteriaceae bacterium]
MKFGKWSNGILAAFLAVTLLAGCGGQKANTPAAKPAETPAATPKQGEALTVFTHLTDDEIKELEKLAEQYNKETGNNVKVVKSTADFQAEALAAQSKKYDVMYGLAHDNLGTFAKAGLLAEVPAGTINDADFNNVAIKAVTINGKKYGVPIALETYSLFYNTAKVKEAPKSWEDLVKIAKDQGFAYDINNFYYSFAFLSANGGYVFKDNNGSLDPKDIGLGNEGAVKGWDFLQKLVTEYKFMDKAIAGDIAEGMFTQGKTAFFISGPWSVGGLKKANTPFAVSVLPTLNGQPLKPFVGVQAAFVNAKSDHQKVAFDYLKWMAGKNGTLYKVGNRLPVLNSVLNSAEVTNDPILNGFVLSSKNGIPMPNIPEVQTMWTPGADTLKAVTAGQLTPQKAAEQVVAQMKDGIAKQQK